MKPALENAVSELTAIPAVARTAAKLRADVAGVVKTARVSSASFFSRVSEGAVRPIVAPAPSTPPDLKLIHTKEVRGVQIVVFSVVVSIVSAIVVTGQEVLQESIAREREEIATFMSIKKLSRWNINGFQKGFLRLKKLVEVVADTTHPFRRKKIKKEKIFTPNGKKKSSLGEFTHGVFECWLHPARYRTEACKDGKNCKRKVCFFAHSPRQLRILPVNSPEFQTNKKQLPIPVSGHKHCCLFCHGGLSSSPTSTLLDMSHLSPPLSPPVSPAKHQSVNALTPMSRNSEAKMTGTALPEMINSLDAMSFNEANKRSSVIPPWIDISILSEENQQQFILSPSTPNSSRSVSCVSRNLSDENKVKGENGGLVCSDPDVGWIDELLM